MTIAVRILRIGIGIAVLLRGATHIFGGTELLQVGFAAPFSRVLVTLSGVALALGLSPQVVTPVVECIALAAMVNDLESGAPVRIEPVRDFLIVLGCAALMIARTGRANLATRVLRWGAGGSLVALYGAQKTGWLIASLRAGTPWEFAGFVRQLGFPFPTLLAAFALASETVAPSLVAAGVALRAAAAMVALDMAAAFSVSLRLQEEPLRAALYMVTFAAIATIRGSSDAQTPRDAPLLQSSAPPRRRARSERGMGSSGSSTHRTSPMRRGRQCCGRTTRTM